MEIFANFGVIGVGAALAFAALGSAMGIGAAAQAAIGAWKKCFIQNKEAPFTIAALCGFPLSQTIYGFILMLTLIGAVDRLDPWLLLGAGTLGGIAIGASALFQGKAVASAADAIAEAPGKGLANYILVLGLIETVALFVMAFLIVLVG